MNAQNGYFYCFFSIKVLCADLYRRLVFKNSSLSAFWGLIVFKNYGTPKDTLQFSNILLLLLYLIKTNTYYYYYPKKPLQNKASIVDFSPIEKTTHGTPCKIRAASP
jgi:hypothetical protein